MLLWINGPFGGGKTHTAAELHRRLPTSVVCDPEHIGFGLHRTMPASLREDFQDLRAWRQGVVEVLSLVADHHPGPMLVPMTITDPAVFDETVGELQRGGVALVHVTLMASPATVLHRLRHRGFGRVLAALGQDPLAREAFAVARVDSGLAALRDARFAEHVDTEGATIPEVAERVGALAGLRLLPRDERPFASQRAGFQTTLRALRLRD